MKKIFLTSAVLFSMHCFAQTQNDPSLPPPKPPTVEERLKSVQEKMDKELKLNDAQKKQVAIAYKDFFIQMDALRKKNGNTQQPPPPPPPPPGKKEEIDKLVTERDAKIAKALSLDEYKKYVEIEKTMRPPMPPKHQEQQVPPPSKQ